MVKLSRNTEFSIQYNDTIIALAVRVPSAVDVEELLSRKFTNIELFRTYVEFIYDKDGNISAEDFLNLPGSFSVMIKTADFILNNVIEKEFFTIEE